MTGAPWTPMRAETFPAMGAGEVADLVGTTYEFEDVPVDVKFNYTTRGHAPNGNHQSCGIDQ